MSWESTNLKYQACSLAGLISKIGRTDSRYLAWPLAQQQYGLNVTCRRHLAPFKLPPYNPFARPIPFNETRSFLKNHNIEAQRKKLDFFQVVKHFKSMDQPFKSRAYEIPNCSKYMPIERRRAPKMVLPLQKIISRHFNQSAPQIYKVPSRRPENHATVSPVNTVKWLLKAIETMFASCRSKAKPTEGEGEKKWKQDDHKGNEISSVLDVGPSNQQYQSVSDRKKTLESGETVANQLQLRNIPKKGRFQIGRIYGKFKHNAQSTKKSKVKKKTTIKRQDETPLRSTVQEKVRKPKGELNRMIARRRKSYRASKPAGSNRNLQESAVRGKKSEKPKETRSGKRSVDKGKKGSIVQKARTIVDEKSEKEESLTESSSSLTESKKSLTEESKTTLEEPSRIPGNFIITDVLTNDNFSKVSHTNQNVPGTSKNITTKPLTQPKRKVSDRSIHTSVKQLKNSPRPPMDSSRMPDDITIPKGYSSKKSSILVQQKVSPSYYDDNEDEVFAKEVEEDVKYSAPSLKQLLAYKLELKKTPSLVDIDPKQLLFYPYEHIYSQEENPEKVTKLERKRSIKVSRKVARRTEVPRSAENLCNCNICLTMQRYRNEPDSPLIANMKREAKRIQLKAYLREQNCRTSTAHNGTPDNSGHNFVQDDIEPCCQIIRSTFHTYRPAAAQRKDHHVRIESREDWIKFYSVNKSTC